MLWLVALDANPHFVGHCFGKSYHTHDKLTNETFNIVR